jgi:hypothetical protein
VPIGISEDPRKSSDRDLRGSEEVVYVERGESRLAFIEAAAISDQPRR